MDEPGTAGAHHDRPGSHAPACAAADDVAAFRQAAADAAAVGLEHAPPGQPASAEMLVPFVVQSGRSIYLLAWEQGVWVLAELSFDDRRVAFREARRAAYAWPREAFGALLSRVATREVDESALEEVARDFRHWLGGHFVGHA